MTRLNGNDTLSLTEPNVSSELSNLFFVKKSLSKNGTFAYFPLLGFDCVR